MSSDDSSSNSEPAKPAIATDAQRLSANEWVITLAVAVGLTLICWSELWLGHGFIGGDIYAYFLPQKTYYADALKQGTIPLWNNLTGFGYPLVGESQTGVFYPPNLLLYWLLDVQTAYNASHIAHYIFAFVGVVLLGKRLGMSLTSANLAAVVFVYGWFPVRACHEWAIVTGTYLPWAIWCTEGFVAQRRKRDLVGLAGFTTLQLLAGHFNLAFITTLSVLLYRILRVSMPSESKATQGDSIRPMAVVFLFVVIGYFMAAIQLWPSYELKQHSQRAETITDKSSKDHPQYGHIPPWYLSQLVIPWTWYGVEVDLDGVLNKNKPLAVSVATNKVEAHLYCGIIPFLLATIALLMAWKSQQHLDHRNIILIWFVLGLLAAIYATGWLYPVLGWLPGFSYFRGPGRYGIVTTLAIAVCAGIGWDMIAKRIKLNPSIAIGIGVAIIGVTTADLMWAASNVGFNPISGYTFIVADPPVNHRFDKEFNGQKTLRAVLEEAPNQPVRLFAPGANIPNIIGVSSYPVYLGIAPKQYSDPELQFPELPEDQKVVNGQRVYSQEQVDWMYEHGITHVLTFHPVDSQDQRFKEVWQGFDPVLNPALGRFRELFFLSELRPNGSNNPSRLSVGKIERYGIHTIEISTDSPSDSPVFRDLNYPGWYRKSLGNPPWSTSHDTFHKIESVGTFRFFWGEKPYLRERMHYRPISIYGGAVISLLTFLGLFAYGTAGSLLPKKIAKAAEPAPSSDS